MCTEAKLIRALQVLIICCLVSEPALGQVDNLPKLQVVDVCDVMNKLDEFSGKVIAVRGELYLSTEIEALGNKGCAVVFEAAGRKWPNAIAVGTSNLPTTGFALDSRLLRFYDGITAMVRNLYFRGPLPPAIPPFRVIPTFVGKLETRTPDFFKTRGPIGFGHLASYPALLGVIGVVDIMIEPTRPQ